MSSPQTSAPYRIVDLFSGCGGLSRGFEWTGRFATEFGVELHRHPAETFAANLRNSKGGRPHVFIGNVEKLLESDASLWRELNSAGITKPGEVHVLVGGPPCQGFSRNGVRRYEDDSRAVRFYDDPRNHLYKCFLRILEVLSPPLVLIENVREFLNFGGGKFSRDLLKRLDELGYDVVHRKVCAADYGVPQIRHRVFFVAVKKGISDALSLVPLFPEPTRSAPVADFLFRTPAHATVRDAIADLPPPVMRHSAPPQPYLLHEGLSELAKRLRSARGCVHNHVARVLSETSRRRINAVGTGRMRDVHEDLQTESFYGSAYRRLSWDEPALTVTTWVYHVGSGQFAHPVEDRAITMREAARLQGFDDDFVFPPLINPVSQMIGNAVPPLLARAFADEFLKVLDACAALGLTRVRVEGKDCERGVAAASLKP